MHKFQIYAIWSRYLRILQKGGYFYNMVQKVFYIASSFDIDL